MLSETVNICFLSTIFVISFGYCKRECRRSSSSALSKSSRKIKLLWSVAGIDIFFRVHYKTDYPSDNSGQPCLKEGPTKDSLFSVKSGQAYPLRFHFSKVEPVFQFLD